MSGGAGFLSTAIKIVAFVVSVIAQLIHGAQVIFNETPKDVTTPEGLRAHFNCSARSAHPSKEPLYFWKFNGEYIEDTNAQGFIPRGRTLIIQAVNGSIHQGKYQCVAFRPEYGAIISLAANLKTTYLDISRLYSTPYYVKETSSILIKAPRVTGRPDPVFTWFYRSKNGNFTLVDNSVTYITKAGHLLIPSITKKYKTVFRLYVSQPSLVTGRILAAEIDVIVVGQPVNCSDNTIQFPLKEVDKTLNEGDSLLIECLGVAKRCSLQRDAYWEMQSGKRFPARLFIKSVSSINRGNYICHTKIGNQTSGYTITITIKEKPVMVVPVPNDMDVNIPTAVSSGFASHATKIEWYTDGELITGSTSMLKKRSDNKLQFVHLSHSLSGVYQIFYINGDLVTVKDVNIFVTTGPDFGQRVSGLSGNIIFNPFLNSASGVTHSYWLIQVPAVRTVYLTIASPPKCAIDGTTQLQVYQGPAANGKSVKSVCRDGTFTPVVDLMKGPFISLILVTRNLTNSGFIVYFDVNRPVTTLPPPTTTKKTTTTAKPKTTTATSKASSTSSQSDLSTTATSTKEAAKTTKPFENDKNDKVVGAPIGAIVGGIVGATVVIIIVIVALFCYRQRQDHMKSQGHTPDFSNAEKGAGPHNMPRNTYMMRRPGFDPTVPRFTVQPPSGRPMPDVIPDRFEMGYVGQCKEDADNRMYERVEDVIKRSEFSGQNIGNLAYQPAKSPKAVVGRRIPSGPGGQHSKFIRTDISPRPLDPTLQQQQQSKLDNETYDSVDDDNDYLAPVQTLPRLSSMEGRPLPSPSESSPVYHMLEEYDEPQQPLPQGNDVYEMPVDTVDNTSKLESSVHPPSENSGFTYEAVEEEAVKQNENTYEPLTLERDAKPPYRIDDEKDEKKDNLPKDDTIKTTDDAAPEGDYCDPYEPSVSPASTNENKNEYQPLTECQSPNENNNHKKLEATASGCYETLDDAKDGMENYQALTLPRRSSIDDGLYMAV